MKSMTECLEDIAPKTDHEDEILDDVKGLC